jgi:NTP pyrophosphatase (non-canonical NTP hydrolase)
MELRRIVTRIPEKAAQQRVAADTLRVRLNPTVSAHPAQPTQKVGRHQFSQLLKTVSVVLNTGWNLMLEKVKAVNRGLARKFPDGVSPFRIMTSLLEEGGELAQQVNLFEATGIKRQKYGEPDRAKLAQEVKGVLLAVFQIVDYYDIESELDSSLDYTLGNLQQDGYLEV